MNPIFGCKVKISADINPRNIWFDGLDNIPEDAILVTVDVSALYTNLNKGDSIEAVRKVLETRQDKSIPTDFIIKLLDLVLRHNIFEFDGELYQQLIGSAMGSRCSPNVADIFMSFIDEEIKKRADKYGKLLFYGPYLDDISATKKGTRGGLGPP